LSATEIGYVDIGPEPDVVGEIPPVVVGIFVNHDLIAVPKPIAYVVVVIGRHAEVKAAEPETLAIAASEMPNVSATEATGEAAVLPGMIQMVVFVTAAGIVAYPVVVAMNVRGLRMAGTILKAMAFLRTALGSAILRWAGLSSGRGSVSWNVTMADVACATA
jgi:hypothetical protein